MNEGMITSSPGPRSQSMAAISRAAVQEGVISTLLDTEPLLQQRRTRLA